MKKKTIFLLITIFSLCAFISPVYAADRTDRSSEYSSCMDIKSSSTCTSSIVAGHNCIWRQRACYVGSATNNGSSSDNKSSDNKSSDNQNKEEKKDTVATPEDNGRVGENFCSEEEVVTALKALGIFIMIAKFAIPMIIIALGTWDLVKAITAGTEDTLKKQITSLIVRAVVGLAVLFAPTIANAILSGLNQYNVISDDINECQNCLLNPLTEGKCAGSDNNKTVDAGDLNYDKSVDAGDLNYNKSADAGDLNYNKSADAGDLNYNKNADAGDLNYNKNAEAGDLNYNKSASGDLNYNKDASAGDLNNNKNVSTGETNNNKNVNVGETQQPSNVVQTGKTTNPTNRVNSN